MPPANTSNNAEHNAEGDLSDKFDSGIFKSIVENMPNGVALCKMTYQDEQPIDFIYLYTNTAFEQLTGLKDAVGKFVSELIPGIRDSDPQLFELYDQVVKSTSPQKFEHYVVSLSDWFSVTAFSPKPEHFVVIFNVITDNKKSSVLADLSAACASQQAFSVFLVTLNEEIRILLNAIIGLTDLLKKSLMTPVQSRQLEMIEKSAQALHSVFQEILEFSKKVSDLGKKLTHL